MSINSVSSSSQNYPPTASQNAFQQNFQTLSQVIQSGNLSAAQSAYATLTQNAPAQGGTNSNNPFQQAIASIGSALLSGDIGSAQSALTGLQQTMKAHHHGHHRHAPQSASANSTSQTASTTIAALPTTASAQVDVSA